MKRRISKVFTPALLATSMVINSMCVNVLASTNISFEYSETDEGNAPSISKDYEVDEYENLDDIFTYSNDEDVIEDEYETATPSDLKRISNEIMTLALEPGTHENPAKTAEELAEALGGSAFAVADGNEVTLQQTVYLINDLFIGASEDPITVNLGSHNIQLGDQNQILLWSNKAEGTYADVTFTGTGKISNNGIYSTIQIYAGGNLTIDGITVENGYDDALTVEGGAAGAAISTNADSCTSETETNITITSGNVVGSQGINFVSTGASDSLKITGGTVTGKLGQGVMVNSDYNGASGVINFDLDGTGKVVSEADGFSAVNAFSEVNVVIKGGTIEATGANSTGINIYGESSVTIEDGQISGTEIGIGTYDNSEIDVNGGEVSGRYGALSYGGGTLRVTSGTIRGTAAAVAGNGTDENENTTIEIEGGTLEGGIAGIYHPQKGKLTITGGTITGQAGIVARGGEITISGEAEIEATGTGTITIGDAKHSGSSVKVPASAIVADQNTGYDSENMKVTISGGTIKAAEGESAVVMTTNGTEDSEINHEKFDITGGAFTNPGTSFAKYVDDEYVAANKGEETVVGEDLQAVVEALGVTSGDTLTVEKAPEGSSVSIVDADVTIDNQSGNDVTVNNHEITTGSEYTTSEDDFVAKINDAGYASLQDAVTHAQPGDTINLLTDITLENTVDITKAITLDLGTHEITINKAGLPGAGIRGIGIAYTDVTMRNGTITSTVATEEDTLVLVADGSLTTENMHFKTNGGYAINLYEFEALHRAQPATVTLSADSTIENEEGEGITAYGSQSHHTINVEGTITVKGTHPAVCGSYQNLAGTDITIGSTAVINGSILQMSPGDVLVKNGATIDNQNASASAIAITKGSLTIEDGATIKAASNFEEYQPTADGHVFDGGSAIFVEPTGNVKVTIKGGTITSENGYALYAPKTGNAGLTLDIQGGSFTGNEAKEAVSVDALNEFISGGDYSSDVNDYVVPDKLAIEVSNHSGLDKFYVGDDAKEAIAAAKEGDTVTVYQAVEGESLEVPNGVTVSNETGADITVNNDTVGSGEEITVKEIARVDGKTYSSLEAAIAAAAGSGSEIELLGDVETDHYIGITDKVVINLNNHDITRTGGNAFYVSGSGNLTINGEGNITTDAQGAVILVDGAGASLTINGGTYARTGNSDEDMEIIHIQNQAKATIAGGTINGGDDMGVGVTNSTLDVTGGNISGLCGINTGGNAKVTVSGGNVSGTETGVVGAEGSAIEIKDQANVSGRYGASAIGGAKLTVSGGTVTGTAAGLGGSGTDTSKDTEIKVTGGKVSGTAAGIYHPNDGKLTVTGGEITGGAGIVVRAGQISVSDSAKIEATSESPIIIGDASDGTDHYTVPASGIVVDHNDGYNKDSDLEVDITGGEVSSKSAAAVVVTKDGKETTEAEGTESDFDITGGTFKAPEDQYENFADHVNDNYFAARVGGTAHVGTPAQSVVDEFDLQSGDNMVVEKAKENDSFTVRNGVTVDNHTEASITINGEEIDENGHYPLDPANTEELKKAAEAAGKISADDYVNDGNWSAYESAYKTIKDLFDRINELKAKDQAAIDNAVEAFNMAKEALKALSFEELTKAIEETSADAEDTYTSSTWTPFANALVKAKEMRDDHSKAGREQAAIDLAVEDLREAFSKLEKRADLTKLDNAIKEAKEKLGNKTEADFESGWAEFKAALDEAEGFMKDHPEADRSEMKASEFQVIVDQMTERLNKATDNLVERVEEDLDLETLKDAVAEADAKKESDYTSSSWSAFAAALKNAKAILAESGLTKDDQVRVDAAKDALIKAMDGLVKKNSGGSSSSITGHYSGSSSSSGSSSTPSTNGSITGTWSYDSVKDRWTFNHYQYKNQWVYVYNPYAGAGQSQYDWFYFDANGEMVTGWFTDKDGLVYYLNETSDGTRGAMKTGWVWIGGKCYYFHEVSDGTKGHLLTNTTTPDGYTVNAEGAWILNGNVVER